MPTLILIQLSQDKNGIVTDADFIFKTTFLDSVDA